jgi:hypothetical protein
MLPVAVRMHVPPRTTLEKPGMGRTWVPSSAAEFGACLRSSDGPRTAAPRSAESRFRTGVATPAELPGLPGILPRSVVRVSTPGAALGPGERGPALRLKAEAKTPLGCIRVWNDGAARTTREVLTAWNRAGRVIGPRLTDGARGGKAAPAHASEDSVDGVGRSDPSACTPRAAGRSRKRSAGSVGGAGSSASGEGVSEARISDDRRPYLGRSGSLLQSRRGPSSGTIRADPDQSQAECRRLSGRSGIARLAARTASPA